MRDMNLEAAIWHLFTSLDFLEAAARECEDTMEWFGTLAISRGVPGFGRNNEIFDKFKAFARDFRRGAELAKLGDYKFIWNMAGSVRGDVRGMMEQPLHSWMTNAEYQEFSDMRISRLLTYAGQITRALNNGMIKGKSFFHPSPECPERANDDDGFPGEEIIKSYRWNKDRYKLLSSWDLPEPLPEYVIDRSVACKTGAEVPWTGVWYPETGLERYSLTFAIKGMKMQPAFRIIKTKEELKAEGAYLPSTETVAVATTWHPLIPSGRPVQQDAGLMSKAGETCPKIGVWQAADMSALERTFEAGEPMPSLGSAYGLTVWRWLRER